MDLSTVLQLTATVCAVWGAFAAYRVRDNERAVVLSEMRSDIRHIIKRLDQIENERRIAKIERKNREESA